VTSPASSIDRSCGPSGCEIDWLTSQRHAVDGDVRAFTAFAEERGWGDGLPLVPPTEELVREYLAGSGRFPDEAIAVLPPLGGECTVEKIAVNAAMAGAPLESMPLLIAAVSAIAEPDFNLAAVNATTGSSAPVLVVNGEQRDRLGIPCESGALGGVASGSVAIGRALRLIIRNIAGQVTGLTSKSVYGNPARIAGLVFGELEEASPWVPLGERRGCPGNAVTVFAGMGTMNVVDPGNDPDRLLDQIGRSIAYPGANGFAHAITYSEVLVAINPIWAEMIARAYPTAEDVQRAIWERSRRRMDEWAEPYHKWFVEGGRVDRATGLVPLVPTPDEVIVVCAGGFGGLHAAAIHGWGETRSITRAV
jgi:hypothetical protein